MTTPALALHRCDAIHFDVALFTNLTQDHLDFHADMEDYFMAKRLLFEMSPRASIVHVDDPYGQRLAEGFDCVTFSAEGNPADLRMSAAREAYEEAMDRAMAELGRIERDLDR